VIEPEPSRPGSILRAEREALGVTVREVSETLNLSIAVIEAIEADDHERLPGPVFARGYLRAYARLLELDPEPLVAQYPRPQDPVVAVPGVAEPAIWEWIRRRPALVLGAGAAALGLVLFLLVLALWPEETSPGPGAAPAAESPAPLPFDDPPAAEPEDDAGEDTGDAGGLVAAGFADTDAAEGDDAASGLPVPEQTEARRLTDTGDDRLTFRFSEDCWVEVRNAAGRTLYSNLSRGGSRLELVGQGPFRILLGYAPGVELTFNGEPMSLAPHTRDNVATLVLGQ
jgi:cytoskeleton protein RodZ